MIKPFTPSEAVAVARRLEAEEKQAAARRKKEAGKRGKEGGRGKKKTHVENCHKGIAPKSRDRIAARRKKEHSGRPKKTAGKLPAISKGDARDKIAAKVGMSGRTLEIEKKKAKQRKREGQKKGGQKAGKGRPNSSAQNLCKAKKPRGSQALDEVAKHTGVSRETVRAVVEAFAKGEISLEVPPRDTPKTKQRYAPGFVIGNLPASGRERPYSAVTIAKKLGWDGHTKVPSILLGLELVEKGMCPSMGKPKRIDAQVRYAPSFSRSENRCREGGTYPYTAEQIARLELVA